MKKDNTLKTIILMHLTYIAIASLILIGYNAKEEDIILYLMSTLGVMTFMNGIFLYGLIKGHIK